MGLWALTPPCGLCTPLPGHGSVTRRRLSSGLPVSGLQGQLGPQLLAPGRVAPGVRVSVSEFAPHTLQLCPRGGRAKSPGLLADPSLQGVAGDSGVRQSQPRAGGRGGTQRTPAPPRERSFFLWHPRVSRPSAVQEVGKSIKGVFQFAFFPPFFGFSLLAGPCSQVTVSEGPACVPRAAHRSWGEAQRLQLSEGPLFTGP